ncbi:mitogen-activated protein kinase kinase kinase [Sarracenia purpurea var. burkii]
MATGKPPWSQQYQEVAALFHIGTTKSHPPIPEHLSVEAKDFLSKCLRKEPNSRPTASDLLQHPFVTGEHNETHPALRASVLDSANGVRCSTIYPEKFSGSNCDDDMCQIDDNEDLVVRASAKFDSALLSDDINKSFNPMSEPNNDWSCKFDESPELDSNQTNAADTPGASGSDDKVFTFPTSPLIVEDDDEVTESKIRAFLNEKALDLKKLQTPLYEEFYNSLNAAGSPSAIGIENKENLTNNLRLPPKSRSPKQLPSRRFSAAVDVAYTSSSGTRSHCVSDNGAESDQTLPEVQPTKPSEWKELLVGPEELICPSASVSERQRRWEEELYEELERKREMMRQVGVSKTSSPNRIVNRQKDRSREFPVMTRVDQFTYAL